MKRLFMLCGCMSLYSLTAHATATIYTWTGANDSNMANSLNWDANGVPPSGTTSPIVFPGTLGVGASFTPNNNIAPNFEFESLTFNAGTAYTLTGQSLLIPGAIGCPITFNTTGSSITAPINISASSSVLSVFSTGTNTLSGGLSGGGVLSIAQGQVNIGGPSSQFTGTINITAASTANSILQTTTANSIGNTAYVPLGVNLIVPAGYTHSAQFNLANNNQTIGGLSGTTGTSVDIGSATLTLSTNGSYATPFYGSISGSGTLNLVNGANLALIGSSNLSGFTGNVTLDTGAALFTTTLGNISSFSIGGGGGTLQLQLGDATVTQNITMTGQTAISTNGGNITYTGTLSGAGTLVKLGSGALILNGTNTGTTGPVQIQGGILNVTNLTLPSGPITFEGIGGTLQAASDLTLGQPIVLSTLATIDTNGHTVTLNGPVSGGNPFTKDGLGTLILGTSGNNFTGKTTILKGTLNATSTTFPCGAGQVQQLVFDGSEVGTFQAASDFTNFVPSIAFLGNGIIDTNGNNMTLNGVLGGSYALIKQGAGTLTLNNSSVVFTGNVQINNGTLNAKSTTLIVDGTGTQQLIFADSGNGIFQLGSDFTDFKPNIILQSDGTIDTTANSYNMKVYGNVVGEPTYTLHVTGSGQVHFYGQSFFEGLLNLKEGTNTTINGLSACDIILNSGGLLKGVVISSGALTVNSGATYHPGNSIGHPTLGALTLNAGSTTMLDMDASDASSVTVTGAAVINGTLQMVPAVDAYPHQGRYLLVEAGDLSGTFSQVAPSPGFTFDLNYLGNDIYLDYVLAIPSDGLRGNALKTANYLNAYALPSDGFTQLAMLSGDALQDALNSVSPARNGFGTYIAAQTAFSLSNLLSVHLDNSRFMQDTASEKSYTADRSDTITPQNSSPENKFSAWITGFGEFAHQTASEQNPSFNYNSEAALIGFDYNPGNKGLAGATVGYAHSYYHENHHAGHGNINYYFASLYGNAYMGDFYLSPAVWGMFNKTQNRRNISFSGFTKNAHADIYAWQLIPHLEAGYDIGFSWGNMVPFTAADWAISWQRGYQEHGASPFNIKQKAKNSSMVRSETGLKFSEQWDYRWGSFFLKEKASYVFEKPYGTGTVNSSFVGSPSNFTVTSVNQNLNLGSVGLDFVFAIGKKKPVKIELGLDGEFGANYWSGDVILTINKNF